MSEHRPDSEGAQPERRRFVLVVGVVNLLFLAFDLAAPSTHQVVVLLARALLSLGLLTAPALMIRVSQVRVRAFQRGLGVFIAVTFGAIVWGSDGLVGRYGHFYSLVPFIVAIMIPDDPWTGGLSGVTVAVTGLFIIDANPVFWVLGSLAITLYASAGAWFHREGLRRQDEQRERELQLERRLVDLEKQRALDDRLSLLGRLVAEVAHELRTPLTFISLNVTLLRGDPDQKTASDALGDVEGGLERIRLLIEDLRTFAKDEAEPIAPCALLPILDDAQRIAHVRVGSIATVERVVAADLPLVMGSRRRLSQVFVNLLVNAADALERCPAPRRVRIDCRREGTVVVVSVEDSGKGIAPEMRPRLFTPFMTSKGEHGTGLGLSLSRDYLATFRATIEAGESDLGGARFTVRLPAVEVE